MSAPRQTDADRWAIAKTAGGAIVTIFTGLIIVFGSSVVSALSQIPSMQHDIERLDEAVSDFQKEIREGTRDRYYSTDARREHDKLEAAIKDNEQRLRSLESR
jgi:peptidoglycan hydrolase CwlO-like protein